MAGRDMTDFMADHPGKLGLVIGEGEEAACDIDIAAGQGEGVYNRAIENREGPFGIRLLCMRDNPAADTVDIGLEFPVTDLSAKLLHDLRVGLIAGALIACAPCRNGSGLAGRGTAWHPAGGERKGRQTGDYCP